MMSAKNTTKEELADVAARRVRQKLVSLSELSNLRGDHPDATIVHCHGTFDLLHPGHIRHLHEARDMGDVLVVTVTPDRFVNKGPERPVFTEELRAETLAALDCVDFVAINTDPKAIPAIEALAPDLYVKGPDYADPANDVTGGIVEEEEAVEDRGGRLVTTSDITFSSSRIINRYLSVLPEKTQDYLREFSSRYQATDVISYLEAAGELSVLVVGEAILDEYHYVECLGKATKDPVLVTRREREERYAGGVLAIANHLAGFCKQVHVVTMIGEDESHADFVRTNLAEGVEPIFIRNSRAPTIVKRRFVDSYLTQTLFEVCEVDGDSITNEERTALNEVLDTHVPEHDAVIVADYGHGMLDSDSVSRLADRSPFLAVNTQTNAGNRGFNTISKYPRADWFCLAEHEVMLDARDRDGNCRTQLQTISENLGCEQSMMTRGKHGTLGWSTDEGFHEAPAMAHRVVDRIGAGDAVFALTTLAALQGAPIDVLSLLGNVVGAEAVQFVGNRDSIERVSLMKHIETLLK